MLPFRRIIKTIFITLLSIISLTVVVAAFAIHYIFTPEKITPIIVEQLHQKVNEKIEIGSVELTLFSTFPDVTLEVEGLTVAQSDSTIQDLVAARKCRVTVQTRPLLNKKIIINEILLDKASINLYVDSLIRPIQCFKIEPTDTLEQRDSSSFNIKDYTIKLERIKIDSSRIVVDDRKKDFYAAINGLSVDMGLSLSPTISDIAAKIALQGVDVRHKEKIFSSNTSIEIDNKMELNRDSLLLTITDSHFKVNEISFSADGTLRGERESKSVLVDMRAGMSTPSIAEFMNLVPDYIFNKHDSLTTSGNVDLTMAIKGRYNEHSMPEVNANIKIEDGRASYASRPISLEDIDCSADMLIDMNRPERCYAKLHKLHVNTSGVVDVTLEGELREIMGDPAVDINIASDIDFDRIGEILPLQAGVTLRGRNISELKSQFRVSDIKQQNYGKIYLTGNSHFKDLKIDVDGKEFSGDSTSTTYLKVDVESGTLNFGDKVKENNSRTLLATINFSGVGFEDKHGGYVSMKHLDLTAGANFDRTTQRVNGVGVMAQAQNSTMGIGEDLFLEMLSNNITLTITPERELRKAMIKADISSKSITASQMSNNSSLNLSNVVLDMDFERQQPRDWSMMGDVGFQRMSLYSDLFPLYMSSPRTSVSVDTNTIKLNDTTIRLGESNFTATGEITNLIRALFFDPQINLAGQLSIKAPLLNVSELIEATNKSVLMTTEQSDSLAHAASDTTDMMLLVPKNVDFAFDIEVEKLLYDKAEIDKLKGEATIKDGLLALKKLSLETIGSKSLSALQYYNIDHTKSNLLLMLNMRGVEINRIGELLPSIVEMLPVVEQFDGKADFMVKARSDIKSDLSLDVPTFKGAISLRGKDLVLMDSKTFTDISKMLRFKNKEHNMIDTVAIFATAERSLIDVKPFELEIDRYRAVIGGTQTIDPATFDLDYKYNVSIIKSPLPFKAGLDISGKNADFDYRITKAKLKNSDYDQIFRDFVKYRESIGPQLRPTTANAGESGAR